LIQETEAREAIETDRRSQQSLDDWYSSRQYREEAEGEPATAQAFSHEVGDSEAAAK
jgi:hypothetical protein